MARAQWSTFSNEQLSNLNSRNTGFCGYGTTEVTATGPTVVELLDTGGEVEEVAVVELDDIVSVVLLDIELGLDDSSDDITSLAADELFGSSVVEELPSVVLEGGDGNIVLELPVDVEDDDTEGIVVGDSEEDETSLGPGLAVLEVSSVGAV